MLQTYRKAGADGDDAQTHDVVVNVQDAAHPSDECYHGEAEDGYPQDGRQEAHDEPLPVAHAHKKCVCHCMTSTCNQN